MFVECVSGILVTYSHVGVCISSEWYHALCICTMYMQYVCTKYALVSIPAHACVNTCKCTQYVRVSSVYLVHKSVCYMCVCALFGCVIWMCTYCVHLKCGYMDLAQMCTLCTCVCTCCQYVYPCITGVCVCTYECSGPGTVLHRWYTVLARTHSFASVWILVDLSLTHRCRTILWLELAVLCRGSLHSYAQLVTLLHCLHAHYALVLMFLAMLAIWMPLSGVCVNCVWVHECVSEYVCTHT